MTCKRSCRTMFSFASRLAILTTFLVTPARAEEATPERTGTTPAASTEQSSARSLFRVELGPTFQRVFRVPVYAGEIEVGMGPQWREFALVFTTGLLVGETNGGLTANRGSFGVNAEWQLDRVRFGLGFRASIFRISREYDGAMAAFLIGPRGSLAYDLYSSPTFALNAGARLALEANGPTTIWGPSLFIGARFSGDP